jgi:orotate phosphoribosyltransferase
VTGSAPFSADEFLALVPRKRGHFPFSSGIHGDLWLDLDTLFLDPLLLQPGIEELARRLEPHGPEGVCGPATGGAYLALLIARHLGIRFFWTEPSPASRPARDDAPVYRLPDSLKDHLSGRRVALVDDAINAGSAVRATWETLDHCGATVEVVGALVVLGSSIGEYLGQRCPARASCMGLPAEQWPEDACPRCAEGVALDG